MAKINGEELTPVKATKKQAEMIQELLDLDAQLKQAYQRKDELINKLATSQQPVTPIAAEVQVMDREGNSEVRWMTFAVGKPTGHYVTYRELDFIHKAKTTKADKEELDIID